MTPQKAAIFDFIIATPEFASPQTALIDWLLLAHTEAEGRKRGNWGSSEKEAFQQEIREKFNRVGAKPSVIHKREHVIPDFLHCNWDEMQVYQLNEFPSGSAIGERQRIHREKVDQFFLKVYEKEVSPPADMIHVSCTGYASPSGAQKLILKKRWEEVTQATHLYHMGCYGSLPAIRVAKAVTLEQAGQVDIVHTELCTLHMNPLDHSSSQLVSQSLFADGCIKYSINSEKEAEKRGKPFLKILGQYEQMIPESAHLMEWLIGDAGFHFVLRKEIPVFIARSLKGYLSKLSEKAAVQMTPQLMEQAVFAIHPGGPKILDYAERAFDLRGDQMQPSREVLKAHGNMSSATLPHIWKRVLEDEGIKNGTKIITIAFGPGLTIAGAILEKIG